jgi:hypothetical protein
MLAAIIAMAALAMVGGAGAQTTKPSPSCQRCEGLMRNYW